MKELSPPWHRPSVKCAGAGGRTAWTVGKAHRQTRGNPATQSYGTVVLPDIWSGALCSPDCKWQTRRNPAVHSYGAVVFPDRQPGRYVRRTANGKLRETAGRKGWTFSTGNCGMVARPPDSLHPKYEAKKGINYYDTANQSEPFFAAVSCSSFINFNLHLDVAQCRLCSRQRQRCRQQFRNYNWQR